MNIQETFVFLTKEMLKTGLIKHTYQTALVNFDIKKNSNKYQTLFCDIDEFKKDLSDEGKQNFLRRFHEKFKTVNKDFKNIPIEIFQFYSDFSDRYIDNDDSKGYEHCVEYLKKNIFKEPFTSKLILNEEKEKFRFVHTDFSEFSYYKRDEYSELINIGGETSNWIIGCLIEYAFFNLQKNCYYANFFMDASDDIVHILGAFISQNSWSQLEKFLKTNEEHLFEFQKDSGVYTTIKAHSNISTNKINSLKRIIEHLLIQESFSKYHSIFKEIDEYIRTYLEKHGELKQGHKETLEKLCELRMDKSVVIEIVSFWNKNKKYV